MMTRLHIDPAHAVLLIVDVQEKLARAMDAELEADVERYVPVLCEAARRFAIPVVVTQQYPQGLGVTLSVVEQALPPGAHRLDKMEFSACDALAFPPVWEQLGRDQWIVTGMETHVCVYQSARSLAARGASVHVVRDAVASRSRANYETGLSLMERAGAVITSTEVVVFDLLGRAGGDDFKALSKLIR